MVQPTNVANGSLGMRGGRRNAPELQIPQFAVRTRCTAVQTVAGMLIRRSQVRILPGVLLVVTNI